MITMHLNERCSCEGAAVNNINIYNNKIIKKTLVIHTCTLDRGLKTEREQNNVESRKGGKEIAEHLNCQKRRKTITCNTLLVVFTLYSYLL